MPFDINGTFSRSYNFEQDRVNGIKIMSDRVDAEFDNYSTAMNQTFLRTGAAPMAANLRLGSFSITGLGDGTVSNPSVAWNNDASSGLYRVGPNQIGMSIAGVLRAQWDANGITGVVNAKGAGSPLTVNSTDSTASKIKFQDNGVTRGFLGADSTGISFSDAGNIQTGFISSTGLTVRGSNVNVGPTSGAAANTQVSFNTTGTFNIFQFVSWSGGVSSTDLQFLAQGGGTSFIEATNLNLTNLGAGTTYLSMSASGVAIGSGVQFKLGASDNAVRRSDGSNIISSNNTDTIIDSPTTGIHRWRDSLAADKLKSDNVGNLDIKGRLFNDFGAVTAPGASANAHLWRDATSGHVLQGSGSSYDAALFNNLGNRVIGVNTGAYKAEYQGALGASQVSGEMGWRDLQPQSKSATYSIGLNDRGSLILITTGGITIPDNSSVAFPVGSIITVYNDSASSQTVAMLGTDTLRLPGTSSTGTRTIAQRGHANLVKVKTTEWTCSGPGVS